MTFYFLISTKDGVVILMKKTPLLEKPFGGSEHPWNNRHMGTETAVCEVCGTRHESGGSDAASLTIDIFFGRQMVEECCGRLLDVLYEESGEEFAIRFLKDFSKNPLDPRFAMLRIVLDDVLAVVDKKLVEAQKQIEGNQKTLDRLEVAKH